MTSTYWTSILSSSSMRTLSTPFAIYCKSFLAVAIGSDKAEEVMRYSYSFSAKMDEHMEPEMETEQDREPDQDPSLAEILSCFFYPTLGILKGLVYTGFEEVTEEIITAMWEFAPAEMWKRISVVT